MQPSPTGRTERSVLPNRRFRTSIRYQGEPEGICSKGENLQSSSRHSDAAGPFASIRLGTMKRLLAMSALAAALTAPAAFGEQEHQHAHGEMEELGTVHFPNSCRPEVAEEFTRAVALLHSFGYAESRLAFQSVAEKDPACGIAYWGIAMTYYHPIWAPPSRDDLTAGSAAAQKAESLGDRAGARVHRRDCRVLPRLRDRRTRTAGSCLQGRGRGALAALPRRSRGDDLLCPVASRHCAGDRHHLRQAE